MVKCVGVDCPKGQVPFTTEGHCCPDICIPDCTLVKCGEPPICNRGEVLTTPPNKCCPVCTRPNCYGILCAALNEEFDCQEGEILTVPTGECCPRCVSSCSSETCFKPLCLEGETLQVPKGKCCPICVRDNGPNCDGILCVALNEEFDCQKGEVLIVPPGECCPRCVRNDGELVILYYFNLLFAYCAYALK